MLARIEDLAAKNVAISQRERHLARDNERMDREAANARNLRADLKAAEDKVDEWAEYASMLRSAINAIDNGALKRKRIVLPKMPKPLETEIPF